MVSETTEKLITLHSIRLVIIGLFLFLHRGPESADGQFVDYAENTELIQQGSGHNITLQCNLKGLINEFNDKDIKYLWYFKQCGSSSSGLSNCYHTTEGGEDDWAQLPCEDNFCKSELQLKNVTENYSGLYKCTVVPHMGTSQVDIKLVRTFQLDIKNTSQKIPEFLEAYPLNISVSMGSQAVFQCRVYSEEYPTIKWFRRLYDLKYSDYECPHSIVCYNGRAYELLDTAREKSISRDVYLSKLILNDVRPQDEGFYACVAISVRGHSIREAYLHMYSIDEEEEDENNNMPNYWSDYSEENDGAENSASSDPKEFWLLFLMPVGLAVLPLSVWLCYIVHRRCRQPEDLMDPADYSDGHLSTDQQRMLRA